MFGIDRFAADCRAALMERNSEAIPAAVRRAVSEPGNTRVPWANQQALLQGSLSGLRT
jgi:hypothetical protein